MTLPTPLQLAIVWHHHQPLYRPILTTGPGSLRMPWVRLHAIRDYFSMAHMVALHPELRLTVNFSPCLLMQIEDQVERGATDVAWELTRCRAEDLDDDQREAILTTFFDADWHNQIFPHPRYRRLYDQRRDGLPFSAQDLRDLQVWFNLAWFGRELREGAIPLPEGSTASVARLIDKGAGFTPRDIDDLLDEQLKVMRAIVPVHRRLLEAGQLELSVTPFFHPILPLLIDTDQATIDRPGARFPPRFAHPEDAAAQVGEAVRAFQVWFGRAPNGAWPAEGAVSQAVVPLFARHGIRWIASDQGVLARSGRWGYDVGRSAVRHRCYRAEQDGAALSVFFRDSELSNDLGFHLQTLEPEEAAARWVQKLKRTASDDAAAGARIVTVVLDGENAWGSYRDDGRPFLHALYAALLADREIRTVTPTELLEGNPKRDVVAHPLDQQLRVYDLYTGSWIDEPGTASGVDLGTWIGEPEENRAWELLGTARRELAASIDMSGPGATSARLAVMAAEGSDWFWWLGDDQDSGHDPDFEALFRQHLRAGYHAAGVPEPASLNIPLVPRATLWTFAQPAASIFVGDSLLVRTNCAGEVAWTLEASAGRSTLVPVGGVMAGTKRHQARLGPFLRPGALDLRFDCHHPPRPAADDLACRHPESARVAILDRAVGYRAR